MARTIGMRKIAVTIAAAGTAQPISATPLFATDFEFFVVSGNVGANGYIGDSTVDNTWIPRAAGQTYNFVHGSGNFLGVDPVVGFDLSKIFIDSDANGDEFIIQYFAGDY